jgi:hypothetical protein
MNEIFQNSRKSEDLLDFGPGTEEKREEVVMDFDRLMHVDPKTLYRKYLFRTGNFGEWANVWKYSLNQSFLCGIKRYRLVIAVLLNLFACSLAADATNHELLVSNFVHLVNRDIGAYVKAYEDIERLAESIGTAAGVINADERFVFAFLITKWSREFGFDPLEVAAIALTESQFNPKAVSPKDARGLMQIHRPSWEMDDYFNTEKNIRKAMQILFMYRNSQPDSYLKLYYGDTGEEGAQYVQKVKGNFERLAKVYKETKNSNF